MSIRLLYLAFFLSGATALAYEATWTRYLGLLVGHDAYAQVVVLVIFLGGMSAGAALIARRTATIRQPLRAYALIEAAIGVLALVFHDVFGAATGLAYDVIFPALGESLAGTGVKWLLAGLLILPQSILLGTTFPLMSAGVLRARPAEPGRVLAWLYFTNSLGAAIGVLVAGFVLLRMAGLPGTLALAGGVNLIIALIALAVARSRADDAVPRHVAATSHDGAIIPQARLLLVVAFGTAVASFAYEIDWIRMLSLVLGSATHAFELMLSAFILGLAIGALAIQRLDRLRAPLQTLGWIQVAMGTLAVLTLPVYVASFEWMAQLLGAFTRTDAGYAGFSVMRYAICLAVMLPSTICAGMTLPLITRALLVGGAGEAAVGRVYAWNTLGSIVGVSLAALVLLPWLGLKPMLLAAGALDIALGLAVFVAAGRTRSAAVLGVAVTAALAVVAARVPLERALVTSGVFRRGTTAHDPGQMIRFYADGRTATVAVAEGADGGRTISTNGKPDASLGAWWWQVGCEANAAPRRLAGDEITQLLLPLVTMSYRPDATSAAVIGFGSGMSSQVLLGSDRLAEVATIEIEPTIIAGAREFLPANQRAYDDPRSRIVVRDAKAHFATTATRWDLILSEPSNPWVSGVAGLFTEEFYHRVAAALAPDGVFGQWLHTYELNDPLVLGVLAAIDRVFPAWRVHQVGGGDLLVVATRERALPPFEPGSVLASPGVAEDLCRFVELRADELAATVLAEAALLRPVLRGIGQPNSDFYPSLDLGAERARYRAVSAAGMMALGYDWFNLGQALLDTPARVGVSGGLALQHVTLVRESWARDRVGDGQVAGDPLLDPHRGAAADWDAVRLAPRVAPNWRGWLDRHGAAMRVHHAGVAGQLDRGFADEATAAARRLEAPDGVVDVLAFRHAVQAWDAAGTLDAAARLHDAGDIGVLLPVDEIRDGAVVMALRAGRVDLARDWLTILAGGTSRTAGDLRNLLLEGWVSLP